MTSSSPGRSASCAWARPPACAATAGWWPTAAPSTTASTETRPTPSASPTGRNLSHQCSRSGLFFKTNCFLGYKIIYFNQIFFGRLQSKDKILKIVWPCWFMFFFILMSALTAHCAGRGGCRRRVGCCSRCGTSLRWSWCWWTRGPWWGPTTRASPCVCRWVELGAGLQLQYNTPLLQCLRVVTSGHRCSGCGYPVCDQARRPPSCRRRCVDILHRYCQLTMALV